MVQSLNKSIYLSLLFCLVFLKSHSQDLHNYVNTTIGSKDNGLSSGYTFIGATYPFGMLQFTPSFFSPNKGFVVTQLSGAGCPNMGNFPVTATSNEIKKSPNNMESFDRYKSIKDSKAGFLSVEMNDGTEISVTTTKRTAIAKFKFNSNDKGSIIIGSGINSTKVKDAFVKNTSLTSCEGYATGGDFCGTDTNYPVFFYVEFDRPSLNHKVWKKNKISKNKSIDGPNSGTIFTFDTSKNKEVKYRISISFVSVENAKINMKSEDVGFNFQSYLSKNQASWNKKLSTILISSDAKNSLIQFYSNFYRSLIHPNIVSDANGEYLGADFKIQKVTNGRDQYSSFSVWDTYRTQGQLLAWLFPEQSSDMMQSLVDFADQSGGYGRWILANIETGIMQGDPTPILISNSYCFGAKDFDVQNAFKHMKRGATIPRLRSQNQEIRPYLEEYIKYGHTFASMHLEYTSSDFAIAQFALQALNDKDQYNFFLKRSKNWQNIYNSKIKWLNSKYPNNIWKDINHDWREGTYKNYFWMVPYDLDGLIEKIGGKKNAQKRLDSLFVRLDARYEDKWFASGNEPDFHVPWVYNWTDEPEKTSKTINRIHSEMYQNSPSGLPGNDDLGTMGSWYVFSSIGLYPVIPGVGGFALNLPKFQKISIRTPDNILTIQKKNKVVDIIKSLNVNGTEYHSTWLSFDKIKNGGDIIFNGDIKNKWIIKKNPPNY
ncbi:MAG: alpha-1,2-mannosidase [Flavobacteriaceae bacterium]|nr:alpha-1,2-mannosidase [Flavobacteriaceae bacterium]|tara:strand:+ start:1107 stop:3245 length:2139 start_codon:yes stop_codon:yes gene_type:complete